MRLTVVYFKISLMVGIILILDMVLVYLRIDSAMTTVPGRNSSVIIINRFTVRLVYQYSLPEADTTI
jgi:hypothetical protein